MNLDRFTAVFGEGRGAGPQPAAPNQVVTGSLSPAVLGLVVFLACSAAGALTHGATACAALAATSGVTAVVISIRAWTVNRRGWRSIAAYGVAALLLFAAAYATVMAAEPGDVVISGGPRMPAAGEAFLLSLSMEVASGPLGAELHGFARVIAFVQLVVAISLITGVLGFIAVQTRALAAGGAPSPPAPADRRTPPLERPD